MIPLNKCVSEYYLGKTPQPVLDSLGQKHDGPLKFNANIVHSCHNHPTRGSLQDYRGKVCTVSVGNGQGGLSYAMCLLDELPKTCCEKDPEKVLQAFVDVQTNSFQDALKGGAEVAICWIPEGQNYVQTVALGTPPVFLLRKIGEKLHPIPLSRRLDWEHPDEQKRLPKNAGLEEGSKFWGYGGHCTSISRSFGQLNIRLWEGKEVLSCEPEITQCDLLPGDTLLMGNDNLWSMGLGKLLAIVASTPPDLALELAQTKANVFALTVRVER